MFYICDVIQKKAAIPEDTSALPPFRIQFSYCLENVGLGYAGPLFYKDVVQNKMQKCYMLLFTCIVSRAIHLELTNDLGADPLKLAVRRVISRRGTQVASLVIISRLSSQWKSNVLSVI